MQMEDGRSIQEALRLGKAMDIYYYTSDTTHKQSIPTVVDTRFYQNLTSLGAGSSTFIISVDQGVGDIILSATLPAQGVNGVDYTGLALPRGWLYALINRFSVRYASSSQYFWTGAQCLIENLREMPNPTTRDNLFALGGALMTSVSGANPFSGDNLTAYAYLNLPHNSPNGSLGKPNPFPSELIGQPIVITLELNDLKSIFSSTDASGSVVDAPSALESSYFQVRQTHAYDSADLMKMPMGSVYSFPTKAFYQNEVQIKVGGGGAVVAGPTPYSLSLTGFRNGQVRSIFFWVTKNSDVNPATNVAFAKNATKFILPTDIELLYNGTVYYRTIGTGAQMWSLCNTETPPLLQNTSLSIVSGALVVTPEVSNWVEMPFSQVFEQLSGAHMYVAGKSIQNAIVNLQLSLPDNDAYTCHFVYSYNCALMIKDRACEYAF
jgi:hypothetical protein